MRSPLSPANIIALHSVCIQNVFNSVYNARVNVSAIEDNEVEIDARGPAKMLAARNTKKISKNPGHCYSFQTYTVTYEVFCCLLTSSDEWYGMSLG